VMANDDAKDTLRKAHGYLLMQAQDSSAMQRRVRAAVVAVAAAARDPRPLLLVQLARHRQDWAEEVLKQIEKLIRVLQDEANDDLAKKEHCEEELSELARDAKLRSVSIDTGTDAIAKDKQKVEELEAQIKEQETFYAETEQSLKQLRMQREREHAEYEKSRADDEAGIELLEKARKILKDFYDKEGFLQVRQKRRQPQVEAGKAPPPPPSTWDQPYQVKSQESQGIQAILSMLVADLEADVAKAEESEKAAVKEFEEDEKDIEASLKESEKVMEEYKGKKAAAVEDIVDQEGARKEEKVTLDTTMKEIEKLTPGCNFVAVNFKTRAAARHAEIDGLVKVQGILRGADFR